MAGVRIGGETGLLDRRGDPGFQRGNDPARPCRLVSDSSDVCDDGASTVAVWVQCCDRSSLSDQRIEQLNMRTLFTLNQFHSQEFLRFLHASRSIYSTRAQRFTHRSLMRTHEEQVSEIERATPSSAPHRSGTRSPSSQRSCVPCSGRSSRSSRGTGCPRRRTAARCRSAARAGWRCSGDNP